MRHEDVLVTKLVPPRPQRRVLPRPALVARLGEALDYRLTLLHAGTGYGKTTALAALDGRDAAVLIQNSGVLGKYEDHLGQLKIQITRTPLALPQMIIN